MENILKYILPALDTKIDTGFEITCIANACGVKNQMLKPAWSAWKLYSKKDIEMNKEKDDPKQTK